MEIFCERKEAPITCPLSVTVQGAATVNNAEAAGLAGPGEECASAPLAPTLLVRSSAR